MALIIVESPTKARTFNRILKGKDYYVFATMGHIRDLPASKMAIDFKKNFEPEYEVMKSKEKIVSKLKELLEKNKEVILATDPDREGEAISYHAAYLLGLIDEAWPDFKIKKGKKLSRIVFHEITPKALEEALKNPGEMRVNLVKAQQARRILDRVVGYELSPILWKKLGKNWLSAGRVQTVALRLIVEREKEIRAFKREPYYQIDANFKGSEEIKARLISKNGEPYEKKFTLKLFEGDYVYTATTITKKTEPQLSTDIKADTYTVSDLREEEIKRYPPPPYTTSLLQQDAFYRLGFPSRLTMRLAQGLYERGLISYHRTDSFNLSSQFVFRAKDHIVEKYGAEYALEKPRGFRTKSRMAQEAHEAIRPTKVERSENEVTTKAKLTANHKKLYQLIYARAVATQMKEATINQISVDIDGARGYKFQSETQQVIFDGFLKVLNPGFADSHKIKPKIKKSDALKLITLDPQEKETLPPRRYNEASLIKTLEERGIGRPSTYAPIISLIQQKFYVEKESRYFVPSALGEAISDYLSAAFPAIFDIDFTADMENKLDDIADGKLETLALLRNFYDPFALEVARENKSKASIDVKEESTEPCPECKSGKLIPRFSKFGKFIACSNYPKCKYTKSQSTVVKNYKCPKCASDVVVKYIKSKKRFFGCASYPKCDFSSWTLKDIAHVKT